jgi:hypothetical protein
MVTKYRVDLETENGWIESHVLDSMTEAVLHGIKTVVYGYKSYRVVPVSVPK